MIFLHEMAVGWVRDSVIPLSKPSLNHKRGANPVFAANRGNHETNFWRAFPPDLRHPVPRARLTIPLLGSFERKRFSMKEVRTVAGWWKAGTTMSEASQNRIKQGREDGLHYLLYCKVMKKVIPPKCFCYQGAVPIFTDP